MGHKCRSRQWHPDLNKKLMISFVPLHHKFLSTYQSIHSGTWSNITTWIPIVSSLVLINQSLKLWLFIILFLRWSVCQNPPTSEQCCWYWKYKKWSIPQVPLTYINIFLSRMGVILFHLVVQDALFLINTAQQVWCRHLYTLCIQINTACSDTTTLKEYYPLTLICCNLSKTKGNLNGAAKFMFLPSWQIKKL